MTVSIATLYNVVICDTAIFKPHTVSVMYNSTSTAQQHTSLTCAEPDALDTTSVSTSMHR